MQIFSFLNSAQASIQSMGGTSYHFLKAHRVAIAVFSLSLGVTVVARHFYNRQETRDPTPNPGSMPKKDTSEVKKDIANVKENVFKVEEEIVEVKKSICGTLENVTVNDYHHSERAQTIKEACKEFQSAGWGDRSKDVVIDPWQSYEFFGKADKFLEGALKLTLEAPLRARLQKLHTEVKACLSNEKELIKEILNQIESDFLSLGGLSEDQQADIKEIVGWAFESGQEQELNWGVVAETILDAHKIVTEDKSAIKALEQVRRKKDWADSNYKWPEPLLGVHKKFTDGLKSSYEQVEEHKKSVKSIVAELRQLWWDLTYPTHLEG